MATLTRQSPSDHALDLEKALAEAQANTRAVIQVIAAVGRDTSTATLVQSALDSVKTAFGYNYGACWMIDKELQHTTFAAESGDLGPAYDRINATDHYQKGRGLTGRTWAAADVIFIPDLSVIKDSELIRTARAAGAVASTSFPFIVEEEVYGVLFFFSFQPISPSEERLDALRNIGRLVGQAFSRLLDLERETAEREALHKSAEQILAVVQAAQRGDLTIEIPLWPMTPSAWSRMAWANSLPACARASAPSCSTPMRSPPAPSS
jgi:methyl-accepting chemotaxis protein